MTCVLKINYQNNKANNQLGILLLRCLKNLKYYSISMSALIYLQL